MKKNIICIPNICLLLLLFATGTGCSIFEDPIPLEANEVPVTSMAFNGTNLNTNSITASETDKVSITINLLSSEITSVRVDSRFRDGAAISPSPTPTVRQRTLTTLTPSNGVATLEMFVRDMGSTPDAGTPTGGQAVILEFVAIGAGKTTTRRFTVNVTSAFSLLSTRTAASALSPAPNQARNPTSASPNQVVFLGYTSAGTLAGQRLTKVEVFRKVGFNGTEEVAPIASKPYLGTAASITDSLSYTIPSNAAVGDSIYLRYLGTFANGQTVEIKPSNRSTPRINVVNNALQDLRSALVFSAGANSSYNMATVTFNGAGTDETVKDLIFDNVAMSLRSGMGSNTNFVLAPSNFNFGTASLQTANTAYMAGTSSTSISGLLVGQTYVCLIRNRTGIDRYGVFRIVGVAPNATAAQSTVAIDFRSLRP